jgi:hypothetical protein
MRSGLDTKLKRIVTAALPVLQGLAFSGALLAAENGQSGDSIVAGADAEEVINEITPDTVDEIVVYGDKPLFALRRDVYRTEERFWEVFSELNTNDEFDVRCFFEVPSFTHIRRHVCRAQFVIDATAEEARFMFSQQVGRFRKPAELAIVRKRKEMQALMEQMIAEQAELRKALEQFTTARTILESEKTRRYGKSDDQ